MTKEHAAKRLAQAQANERKVNKEYAARRQAIRDLMARIETGLDEHQDRQRTQPGNWGYVGDLGHVTELLTNVAEFLTGNQK